MREVATIPGRGHGPEERDGPWSLLLEATQSGVRTGAYTADRLEGNNDAVLGDQNSAVVAEPALAPYKTTGRTLG